MSSRVKQIDDERHPDSQAALWLDSSSLCSGSEGTICIAPSDRQRPGGLLGG